ncbi:MAG TPA: DUF2993 domain-containing protein [Synergistaceae bacterium]|nr:DUF2993 domain-containing protein [Synergistaceae bacterium]
MMRIPRIVLAALLVLMLMAGPTFAGQDKQFRGKVDGHTRGAVLFKAFAEGLKPESVEMILDEEPDETADEPPGAVDLYGCELGGVRIERLEIEAFDTNFTGPGSWESSGPDIEDMLSVNARATILEEDVNRAISDAAFGDDDGNWHGLSLDFSNDGVYARGYYTVRLLFKLDILIELEGRFGIVGGKQVWLEDYTMKVNRVDLPEVLTDRAISQIQPIIDLNEFVFPLTLRTVIHEDDRVILESRSLPNPFDGIRYSYRAERD